MNGAVYGFALIDILKKKSKTVWCEILDEYEEDRPNLESQRESPSRRV